MWEQHPFFLAQAAKAKYGLLLREAEIERLMRSQQQGSSLKRAGFRRTLGSLLMAVGLRLQGRWSRLRPMRMPAARGCGCCQGA